MTGATVSVRRAESLASGIAIIGGQTYRVAQVGSFVRIPQGYVDLYGVVSEVGVSAAPERLPEATLHAESWVTVQLVGESVAASFERGITQYPSVNDEVHIVTEADLRVLYGTPGRHTVAIGTLASAEGMTVGIDLDKMVTRHSAVVGSTGSGKSTTVASILRSIAASDTDSDEVSFESARIVVFDIHGEYVKALRDVGRAFRIDAGPHETDLYVPYWAMDPRDILSFLIGPLDDRQMTHILEKIVELKAGSIANMHFEAVTTDTLTVDIPIPYSLKRLWFELLDPEIRTVTTAGGDVRAIIDEGNPETLTPPRYQPHGPGAVGPFINNIGVLGIRRQLAHLRTRLLDRQYNFLLHPGDYEPNSEGLVRRDLDGLLEDWLGHSRLITILDLSAVPSVVLVRLLGSLLRIIYDALYWGRSKSEGGIERPLLFVMEEAHRYLGREGDRACSEIVSRIVKEGRKYGIGAMIVSQRPSEIDETILSQIGNFITLRLSNANDRARVRNALPDNLSGVVDMLPVLRTGEAIIIGEAARLPTRCRVFFPDGEFRPDSEDPAVAEHWSRERLLEDYGRVVASWRAQLPRYVRLKSIGRQSMV